MVKKFEQAGWHLVHIRGSHYKMRKGTVSFTIPVHGNRDLPKGTERGCLKKLEEVG